MRNNKFPSPRGHDMMACGMKLWKHWRARTWLAPLIQGIHTREPARQMRGGLGVQTASAMRGTADVVWGGCFMRRDGTAEISAGPSGGCSGEQCERILGP
ncbi:uncharacterized protein PG986_005676 [Apiospora aurea]|uniref:Uncharacterized protein n=1 Tax=Apiospora aurea TaxID=335848 RepID=A0ABR1QI89_9PEZI